VQSLALQSYYLLFIGQSQALKHLSHPKAALLWWIPTKAATLCNGLTIKWLPISISSTAITPALCMKTDEKLSDYFSEKKGLRYRLLCVSPQHKEMEFTSNFLKLERLSFLALFTDS
jgi:hypothetical protein